jgi:hypothetical protein
MSKAPARSESDDASARLRLARQRAGFASAAAAAAEFGWPEGAYRHHENGTRGLKLPTARRYAKAFAVSLNWLLDGTRDPASGAPVARIVGQVGAGHEVRSEPGDAWDSIEIPLGPDDQWLAVRGASQKPRYDDADLIRPPSGRHPPSAGLYRECLVQTKDGRTYIKTVVPGTRRGLYTLESHNAEPMVDVELDWVAPFKHRAIIVW